MKRHVTVTTCDACGKEDDKAKTYLAKPLGGDDFVSLCPAEVPLHEFDLKDFCAECAAAISDAMHNAFVGVKLRGSKKQ